MSQMHRLKIDAFKDNRFTVPAESPNTLTLQVNPESYKRAYKSSFGIESATEPGQRVTKFKSLNPETVSFDFYLDCTGVISDLKSVTDEIKKFRRVAYDYNGKIHSPNYLLLSWGDLDFPCRLTSLNVDYTLFKPDGTPLRAKLSVSFQQYLAPDVIAKILNKSSPDLTHLRTVGAGDTLPLMCERIYGDSGLYLEVARHNRLAHFRVLEPGMRLSFPPLEHPR